MVVVKPLAIIAFLASRGLAVVVFESIQSLDFSILWSMHAVHSPWLTGLADVISKIAWKGWLWWVIIIGCWLRGRKDVSAHLFSALVLCTIVGLPLKSIIARPRPDLYAAQQLNIPMPELLSTEHSFPSGHTLLAAAFAFVLVRYWKDYRAWLAFAFVGMVALARVYLAAHWPSDVIASAGLGALAAWATAGITKTRFIQSRLKTSTAGTSSAAKSAESRGERPKSIAR